MSVRAKFKVISITTFGGEYYVDFTSVVPVAQ